jgi:hypothetical protein
MKRKSGGRRRRRWRWPEAESGVQLTHVGADALARAGPCSFHDSCISDVIRCAGSSQDCESTGCCLLYTISKAYVCYKMDINISTTSSDAALFTFIRRSSAQQADRRSMHSRLRSGSVSSSDLFTQPSCLNFMQRHVRTAIRVQNQSDAYGELVLLVTKITGSNY